MTIDKIIKELDENLEVVKSENSDGILYLYCEIKHISVRCRYCGEESKAIHSRYIRSISDLPIQSYQVKLILTIPKYFCKNKKCNHNTFAYSLSFAGKNSLRTNRLDDYIYQVGLRNSSLDAKVQISDSHVAISNNTILRIIKKKQNQK